MATFIHERSDSPAAGGPTAASLLGIIGRIGLVGTAAFLFYTALQIYSATAVSTLAVVAVLVLYTLALTCLVVCFTVRDGGSRTVQGLVAGGCALAIIVAVTYQIRVAVPLYGTDGIAFNHAAAEMVANGQNPYKVASTSLDTFLTRFGVPPFFVTQTTTGGPITRLMSYPALHVLIYVPFLKAGLTDVRWITLAFELGALALIWYWLPLAGRLIAPLALVAERNLTIDFTAGGVTDWLWVLPLVVSAIALRKDRYGLAGLALGLSCAIKQQPWFAVPFLLIWVIRTCMDDGRGMRPVLAFLGLLGAGFLLPNLPFIIASPVSWLQGVMEPALDNTVPDGQGLSILASRGLVGFPKEFYSAALATAFLLSIYLYALYFHALKHLLWVFPALILFFSYRSFQNYFIYWLPPAILWLGWYGSEIGVPTRRALAVRQWGRWGQFAGAAGAAGVAAILLLGSSAAGAMAFGNDRLALDVTVKDPSPNGGLVDTLDVVVHNRSGASEELVFSLLFAGYPLPWQVEGEKVIGPNTTRTFRIHAPIPEAIPPIRPGSDGVPRASSFRVRVNASGSSQYFSSPVITPTAPATGLLNPNLRYWTSASPNGLSAPFGWSVSTLAPAGSEVGLSPLEGGAGIALQTQNSAASKGPWAESGIIQSVGVLAACYELDGRFSSDYAALGQSPAAATGVQVVQGDKFLWFVLSSVTTPTTTAVSAGTTVVEVPARIGSQQTVILNVRAAAAAAGIDLGRPAQIKIFDAVHQSQGGVRRLAVRSLKEYQC